MSGLEEFYRIVETSSRARWFTSARRSDFQAGELCSMPAGMNLLLEEALERRGISRLYSHQLASFESSSRGENPVVVTPTASGKTLCYNLPVVNRLLESPEKRFLYIFPTKALAHDQLHELNQWDSQLNGRVAAAAYDGDTPASDRSDIRKHVSIVLTNPDMLHAGILPHHPKWASFFSHLDTVVIDEMHLYRGVFGSHMANVVRRLSRICRFYGSHPRFILASATVANPAILASTLIEREVRVIDHSGAPSAEKQFLFYNPPLVDPAVGIRRSYLAETAWFVSQLLEQDVQTIVFVRSRMNVEVLINEMRASLPGSSFRDRIRGYRGGYLPGERREIEEGLRTRRILCVVATSALELGVDIGDMEAAVLAGYPGTISSTWQRAGRAGRKSNASMAMLIASPFPLDQYMIRHPDYFFSAPPEHCLVNPDNLMILLDHIRSAAFEIPFSQDEKFSLHLPLNDFLAFLEEQGDLICSAGRWHYSGQTYPAERISLRSVSAESILVCEKTDGRQQVIGQVDEASALFLIHPQAIYLHEGRQYIVEELDLDRKKALVRAASVDYYTFPIEQSDVCVMKTLKTSLTPNPVSYGDVQVTVQVTGYKRIKFHTMENLGYGLLEVPPKDLMTAACWLSTGFSEALESLNIAAVDLTAGFFGMMGAMHQVSAALLMCDPQDLGSCLTGLPASNGRLQSISGGSSGQELSVSPYPAIQNSIVQLFIYDRYPGGIGLSEHLYGIFTQMIQAAYDLVSNCECSSGCPGCIGPVDKPGLLAKSTALKIMSMLLKQGSAAG